MAVPRIGLTGGLASGKSTVLALLCERGATGIDADAISRATTAAGGAAIPLIARQFGAQFIAPDGSLDRAQMRERVYADPGARQQLEAIIHPLVTQESARQVAEALTRGTRCIVFDVPLLVESGRWRSQVDRVLVIDCAPATQIARAMARSGLSAAQAEAIIAAQSPRALRLAAADLVICNDTLTREQLGREVVQAAASFGL